MQVGVAFPADPQPAEVVQPRESALHHPSLTTDPGAVLGAAPGDPVLEPAASELSPVLVVVICAVGDHPLRALPRPPALAGDRADAIDQWQQLGDIVAVAAGQRDRQWNTASVDMQVML